MTIEPTIDDLAGSVQRACKQLNKHLDLPIGGWNLDLMVAHVERMYGLVTEMRAKIYDSLSAASEQQGSKSAANGEAKVN